MSKKRKAKKDTYKYWLEFVSSVKLPEPVTFKEMIEATEKDIKAHFGVVARWEI